MSNHLDFWVPGIPAPQGSKQSFLVKNKEGKVVGASMVEANKKTRPWRTDVKAFAHNAIVARGSMLEGPISITCKFVMHRPVATSKRRPTPPAVKKPDLDKLMRAIGDALKGTVYGDDSQVVEWHGTKRIAEPGEQTGVQLTIGVVPWPV